MRILARSRDTNCTLHNQHKQNCWWFRHHISGRSNNILGMYQLSAPDLAGLESGTFKEVQPSLALAGSQFLNPAGLIRYIPTVFNNFKVTSNFRRELGMGQLVKDNRVGLGQGARVRFARKYQWYHNIFVIYLHLYCIFYSELLVQLYWTRYIQVLRVKTPFQSLSTLS